ncbi:MAG TPA: type II secretion system protein [Candidatus Paceibacterota bacterium]|nr:type II secretion system protein [Verrucomicrobiota bacterium]HOX02277.1 type II secretion system protein [Verrucomicrobiota bacterium]HRZ47141.1 type II secretion system protein [Candidatus Paceibacterota bacterium]
MNHQLDLQLGPNAYPVWRLRCAARRVGAHGLPPEPAAGIGPVPLLNATGTDHSRGRRVVRVGSGAPAPPGLRATPARSSNAAFTLIELLVVIAIIAILAGLLLPAVNRAVGAVRTVQCQGQMRQVMLAARLYADDNEDQFPRSQHSAFANRQLPWERALAPFLAAHDARWTNLLESVYHCSADRQPRHLSYGMNYYFEVGPDDDYPGKPQTWRRFSQIARPNDVIFFTEVLIEADHVMPALCWTTVADAEAEVASKRHGEKSNYSFVDGHTETRKLPTVYHPTFGVDLWNPRGASW